jgi:outer membrane protein OmpA-like peptidoglycan-associated protein
MTRLLSCYLTVFVVSLGFATLAPRFARAQGFNADIHRPVTSTSGYFSQDKAEVLGRGQLNVGLTLDFAHNPLVLRDPASGDIVTDGGVVANRLVSHLGVSVGFFDFLELRARLPFVLFQDGHLDLIRPADKLKSVALSDMTFAIKAGLIGRPNQEGFHLALQASVGFPTGSKDDFSGDGAVSLRPRLVLGIERPRLSVAINGGYNLRPKADLSATGITVGNELAGGAGLGYAAVPDSLWLLAEVYVSRATSGDAGTRDTPTELVAGARYALPGPWMIQGGLGFGLTSGVGAPGARGLLMLAYATDVQRKVEILPPPPPVAVVEPPPAVNPDKDGDGVVDRLDKCPAEAEDKDDYEDGDGCPEPDNDKDGIADATDKCPDDAEDKDGFEDEDGCPDPDNDKDGIADATDKCPGEAEIFNGVDDDDGCPDKGVELAVSTDERIVIRQQVNFDTGKATIKKNSFLLLKTVAKILSLHTDFTKVRVEGHTDKRGNDQKNLKLSQDRADSVRKHLVEVGGIDPARLQSIGFGPAQPIATNATNAGRARNRRVEFVVTEKKPGPGGRPAPGPLAPPPPK